MPMPLCVLPFSGEEIVFLRPLKELRMREIVKAGLALGMAAGLVFTGVGSTHSAAAAKPVVDPIARHIALLKSGKAQQKAAAAYWLGQQHTAAAAAVDPLVELLGDASEVQPSQYRPRG